MGACELVYRKPVGCRPVGSEGDIVVGGVAAGAKGLHDGFLEGVGVEVCVVMCRVVRRVLCLLIRRSKNLRMSSTVSAASTSGELFRVLVVVRIRNDSARLMRVMTPS